MPRKAKIPVAILGGGPSALSCAYYLTSVPALREKYALTIYTMGWKLGGKGASGRGAYDRIEEHGLHVLFGAYHSFFRTMRDCYGELDRPAGHPLRSWRDAFKGHDFGVVDDDFEGSWRPWALEFPRNAAVPGDSALMDSRDYLRMAVQGLIELTLGWKALRALSEKTPLFDFRNDRDDGPDFAVRLAVRLLEDLIRISHELAVDAEEHDRRFLRALRWLRELSWPIVRRLSEQNLAAHRFWLGLDFLLALLGGIVADGVLLDGGFAHIDGVDFREWLERHGAHPKTLDSPFGRMIYDAAFSYAGGDPKDLQIAAGVAVHLLLGFGMYRGHMYWKMQAGMGDTVFAPLYLVLKARGVKFEFFHKVDSLHLSADGSRIERVRISRQAKLAPGVEAYDPLVRVKGLECWPAEPRYEQLEDADLLRRHDLESYYDQPPDLERIDLHAGHDFETLVFGIPIGAVPLVCEELLQTDERWRTMCEHVTSVQTLSFQIWTKPDLAALGWPLPSPLLSVYVDPLNAWCDMSQLIAAESWPEALAPGCISYFTGPQPGPRHAPDPRKDPDFEKRQFEAAKRSAIEFVRSPLLRLMPAAVASAGPPPEFDWNLLVDPKNRSGEARFDAQYWRSNCGPSERCTLAEPGSIHHRMPAGHTGYHNLVVTGDWIDNGIYAACMEGAFNAGILSARAVSGWPFEIDDLGFGITRGRLHSRDLRRNT